MRSRDGAVMATLLSLLMLPIITCHAFTACPLPQQHVTSSRLPKFSSSNSNNDNDDDEISRLIGKRNQIRRRKQEQPEPKLPEEPLVDLDIDKLPQLERPVVKRGKKKDEEESKTTASKQQQQSDSPIIDYMADHDDENDLHIPNRIVVSTLAWGDPSKNYVNDSKTKLTKRMIKAGKFVPGDLQLALQNLLQGGIVFFETSPSYGGPDTNAQTLLAQCLEGIDDSYNLPEPQFINTLGTSPWRKLRASAMVQSLSDSVDRMQQASVEIFTIPQSRVFFPKQIISSALYQAIESGQCNHVGVQNVLSPAKLQSFNQNLENKKGIVLTSNTFEYSLTNTKNEKMINACKSNNIIPLISNPLDDGLASGVFTATNPSGGGINTKFSFKQLEKVQALHSVQETVAERVSTRIKREKSRERDNRNKDKLNTDITTTQVALAYVIAKGGVPIVPVNNPPQAEEVLGCLGWSLMDEEMSMLDSAVALCKL